MVELPAAVAGRPAVGSAVPTEGPLRPSPLPPRVTAGGISAATVVRVAAGASVVLGGAGAIAAWPLRPIEAVLLGLCVAWSAAAVVPLVANAVPIERGAFGPSRLSCLLGAFAGAVLVSLPGGGRLVPLVVSLAAAAFGHLLLELPGRRSSRARGLVLSLWVGAAIAGVALMVARPGDARAWLVAVWLVAVVAGLHHAHQGYRRAGHATRKRLHWVGWAATVTFEVALVVVALELLAGWPPQPAVAILAATAIVPVGLIAAACPRLGGRADRMLIATVGLAGLTGLVIVAYGAVVAVLGRRLDDGERPLLLLSMAAATGAALAFPALRARLTDAANRVIYGEGESPDDALHAWGQRLSRAIPLDELLLQLAESLRKSMSLSRAEVYTGAGGTYDLVAGVPHRTVPALHVPDASRGVVARAGVSGGTWLDVWLPSLVQPGSVTRVAPIAHRGELLGLIVANRAEELIFSEEEDRVLTELARQVGLALHNVQLDSALQASLVELQQANTDLRDSRRRIVTAADTERRKLERNLHDGAQQHLVAMAVKLRIAEDLVEESPTEAIEAIVELRNDLKDAIAELRALAHGIFPPLLSSGGLGEALPSAATRAALPTTVEVDDVGRFAPDVEASVYFCCLEALQNAGKHAGERAEAAVRVWVEGGRLCFEVCDDGAGFDVDATTSQGHGFVNMADRLGTVGGALRVTSAPGAGTTIRGEIPVQDNG